MKTRHRVPSIFNLSMVDVLCCALGCVILLWLLNLRDARQKSAQAGQADEQAAALGAELGEARAQLADAAARYAALQDQLDESQRQAAATRTRLQAVESDRDAAKGQVAQLDKALAALRSEKEAADEAAARKGRDLTELEKKLAATADRLATLQGQLREREAAAGMASRRIDELSARAKELGARADLVPKLREELKDARAMYAAEEALARALEKEVQKRQRELEDRDRDAGRQAKDLAAARSVIEALEAEKKSLRADAERVRLAAENRFAGIALTGRRVVFLVDMSGSMNLIDAKTADPQKWVAVRQTLAKILRSLPDVEKFQVVLFSDRVIHPLGNEGGWIDFDKDSAARVVQALEKVEPSGDTNMYAAFEATFRLRAEGLDTVYLLSDGLPNAGEGLTADQASRLRETEQAELLGKYVRRKLVNDWNRDIRGQGRVKVNAVGFFYESPDVGAFLWALTRENDGSFVGMSRP
jgi:hypothetical protein